MTAPREPDKPEIDRGLDRDNEEQQGGTHGGRTGTGGPPNPGPPSGIPVREPNDAPVKRDKL